MNVGDIFLNRENKTCGHYIAGFKGLKANFQELLFDNVGKFACFAYKKIKEKNKVLEEKVRILEENQRELYEYNMEMYKKWWNIRKNIENLKKTASPRKLTSRRRSLDIEYTENK